MNNGAVHSFPLSNQLQHRHDSTGSSKWMQNSTTPLRK